jgi:hypothetical protein
MNRADFWCRVLGWLQIAGAVICGIVIYMFWSLIFGWMELNTAGILEFLVFVFILFFVLPPFLSGLFTILFSNKVEQVLDGNRGISDGLLRVFMALAGLWSAGVIGFAGISVPALGLFAVLGLISTFIAIMGAEWTADLLKPNGGSA